MEVIDSLILGAQSLWGMTPLLMIFFGVILGILAGAMPGLSPSSAVALLVPFSYTMAPDHALFLLTSIYLAANYGGSITAVLINTPGTPAAAMTAIDGYALTLKGQSEKALNMALMSSTIGGGIGVLVLIFFAIPLSSEALKFSAADYFSLGIFGLATVASMGSGNTLKAIIAVVFGLLIRTMGMDPMTGTSRFTLGVNELYDGVQLIPALIGLFALSVVVEKMLQDKSENVIVLTFESGKSAFVDFLATKGAILKSSLIGTIIGIFPGAGATMASFISYDLVKKSSQHKNEFGHGSLEGLAASESANSASVGGALIPLLALGIPGSATDAVLMGAFMIHDLNPGPMLFKDSPSLVYGIFAALLVANTMIFILGKLGNCLFVKVVNISEKTMMPLILVISVIGSYTVNSSLFDVGICFVFGFLGWVLKLFQFPVAPIVLGLVLGPMIEQNFSKAMMMGGPASFFYSPISLVLLFLTFASFVYPFFKKLRAYPN